MTGDLVTVIVPALEEAADITACLDRIAAQDVGTANLEVLVVDGASRDGTRARAEAALGGRGFHRAYVLENPEARTSRSLNVGLGAATGRYVVRVDARSRIAPDYVGRCVDTLRARPDVGVVGGAQVALPRGRSGRDIGIARALRNRWTTGLSRYRRSTRSGPADTVWMGAFRRVDLLALDGWSADVALNEDFELCARYRARGDVVWFDAGLRTGYLPRPDLGALARQYFRFGRVKGTWWARGQRPAPRQVVLLTAPVGAALAAAVLRRRVGTACVVGLAAAGLAALEVGGTREPRGGFASHVTGAAAILASTGAWWLGTAAGFAGERLGVQHRHG